MNLLSEEIAATSLQPRMFERKMLRLHCRPVCIPCIYLRLRHLTFTINSVVSMTDSSEIGAQDVDP